MVAEPEEVSTALATSSPPSPPEWVEFVRQWWTPIVGVLGALWGFVALRRKLSAKERGEQKLQAKAVRYLVDASRHQLQAHLSGQVHDAGLYDELMRQKVMLDGVRDELWVHDGHASARETERAVEAWMSRTQRIKAKTERLPPGPPDVETFKDGWRGEGER